MGPNRFSHCGHAVLGELQFFERNLVVVVLTERIEFQRVVTHAGHDLRLFGVLLGSSRARIPAIGVDADAPPVCTAQQLPHGLAQQSALEVPQRNVDSGYGSGRKPTAPCLRVLVHRSPVNLRFEGVLALEIFLDEPGN